MRTMKIKAKIIFYAFLNVLIFIFFMKVFAFLFGLILLYPVLYIFNFNNIGDLNYFFENHSVIKYISGSFLVLLGAFFMIKMENLLDFTTLSTDFLFKRRFFILNEELKEIIAIKEAKENLEVTRRAKELHEILSEEQRIKESMKPTQRQKPPQESEGNATKPEAFTGTFNDFEDDILSPEDDDPKRPRGHRQDEPEEPHYDSEAERLKDIIRKRTE